MSVDCEECREALIDLMEGSLGAEEAGALEAHIESCAGCAEARDGLERANELATLLELEEPSETLEARILRAARDRAAERARATPPPEVAPARASRISPEPTPATVAAETSEPRSGSLLHWIGSFAMGPQVAMATLLVLMIGIGLWYLPGVHERTSPDGTTLSDPGGGEVGAQGLEPAEPLELDVDPRSARVRPREHDAPPPRRGANRPANALGAHSERTDALELRERPGGSPFAEAMAEPPSAELGDALEEDRALEVEEPPEAVGTEVEGVRPAGEAPEGPAAAPPTSTAALVRARHDQARALRAREAHREAIGVYERLIADDPGYERVGAAMLELADSYRRLGQLDSAARWLERAERSPAVAARARRERLRLDAERRAAEAVRPPAAAESEP